MRIKVTGYFEPDDDQADPDHKSGLNAEAYDDLILGESGHPLTLTDLEDVDTEIVEP